MRKDNRILLNGLKDTNIISVPDLTMHEKQIFISYIEITRHLIELNKLFHVFRCNLKNLLHHFTISTDDSIRRNVSSEITEEEYILINALTINFISSSKSLIESIETFTKKQLPEADFKTFKKDYLSKIYDESFSYRFLLHMRNYSQHGHLPVNIHDQKVYFDLDEILTMPHFDLNKSLRNEIDDLRKDIYTHFGNLPHISFVFTVADFNLKTIQIYLGLLNSAKSMLKKVNNQVIELLISKPNLVCRDNNSSFKDLVFYDFDGDFYHCFNSKDSSLEMFAGFKKEAKKIFYEETQELNNIKKFLSQK